MKDAGKPGLGEVLSRAREAKGWSLQRAAEAIGAALGEKLSGNSVWKWEHGQTRPEVEKWSAIEEVMGLAPGTIERAITGRDPAAGAAGYSAVIPELPAHARRTIDEIIRTHRSDWKG